MVEVIPVKATVEKRSMIFDLRERTEVFLSIFIVIPIYLLFNFFVIQNVKDNIQKEVLRI